MITDAKKASKAAGFAITVLFLALVSWAGPVNADSGRRPEILIFHSYSPDYEWVQSEQRGIDNVLHPLVRKYRVRIEYMDSNHSPQLLKGDMLKNLYKNKFANSHFSIIIASDNAAFDFLRKSRDELFPGVPVVFCGVNGFEPDMLKGIRGFTGVAEDNDFLGLFNEILQLQPATRRIVIYGVADDPTHKANVALIRKLLPVFRKDVSVEVREFDNIELCVDDARRLRPGSVIVMVGSMRNAAGEGINLQRANEIMSAAVNIPVYTAWDFGLDHGAVGGLVLSGFEQGRLASEIALRILDGERADTIPVLRNAANVYMFDYRQMQRFRLRLDQLPKDSIIFNAPEAAYKIPKGVIWVALVSIVILTGAILVLALNIRSRKRAETALSASEEKYSKAFRHSADVVGIVRMKDGRYIEVSDSFFRIFGYERAEVIGRASTARGNESEYEGTFGLWQSGEGRADLFRRYREQGFVRDMEASWCAKNGEVRTGLFSADLVTVHNEECILFVWHDITERKQAEEERSELEERLRQAHKMESIGMLAGGVAHDFNNLLTPMLGYSELLLTGLDEKDVRYKPLNLIRQAAERAAKLIQQLLAFSRKQMLELKTIDPGLVVMRFEHILRRTIREDIRINIHVPAGLWCVKADVGQIEQVLMNLSVNAQDAMAEGGVLTLELENVDLSEQADTLNKEGPSGQYVTIVVSDTGTGIDKEVQEHLFDPFYTTKEYGKGTGLGLSTVYGIVQQHGGTVSVYSEPGKGSTFRVYLPREAEAADLEAADRQSISSDLPRGSETVLVVEDNEMVRGIACEMLTMLGYKVIAADGPESSISLFERNLDKIDLLLTDVIMPKMNGREVYNRLSAMKPGLKVLFMSGYTSNVIGHHGVLDDGLHLIQKPLSVHVLAEKVRHALD